jgi:hypothetical protein
MVGGIIVGTHAERLQGEATSHELGSGQAHSFMTVHFPQELTNVVHWDYINPFL